MIMENIINVKTFDAPDIDKKEILRYAGVKKDVSDFDELLKECLNEVMDKLSYKVCWIEVPLLECKKNIPFEFLKKDSCVFEKHFKNCSSVVVFAATVGIEIDRLIARYKSISPAKSLMFQAIGAERIESLCNEFNNQISDEKKILKKGLLPRISPGYGSFGIECQKEIFKVLDPFKRIGLSLNESLLMSPSKSVSAVIGVCDKEQKEKINPCKICNMKTCEFRRMYENK